MTGFVSSSQDFLSCMAHDADLVTRARTLAMLADENGEWQRHRLLVRDEADIETVPEIETLEAVKSPGWFGSALGRYRLAAGLLALLCSATLAGWASAQHEGQRMQQHLQLSIGHYTRLADGLQSLRDRHQAGQLSSIEWDLAAAKLRGAMHGELQRLRDLPTYSPTVPGDDATFVSSEESFPDGSIVGAGETIEKVWTIRNSGTVEWSQRYVRRTAGGDTTSELVSELQTAIPRTAPGESCRIAVRITAPRRPGAYYAEWKLVDAQGRYLLPGKQPLYILVEVQARIP